MTRLQSGELVYAGVRRTPVAAVFHDHVARELFATTRDVYVVLGLLPEHGSDRDTADGRPATFEFALARLARMRGADRDMLSDDQLIQFATQVHGALWQTLTTAARQAYYGSPDAPDLRTIIVSGEGEFLARRVVERAFPEFPAERVLSLNAKLGPTASACAPAYALAVLGTERRP